MRSEEGGLHLEFVIMSFNLRYWNETDGEHGWPERRDSVAELIRQQNPLILGTQEGLPSMLEDLDQRLPAYGRIGEGRWAGGENEYNAVYFRRDAVEVLRWGQFWLSETPSVPASRSWIHPCRESAPGVSWNSDPAAESWRCSTPIWTIRAVKPGKEGQS